jgi:RecA-family ATPase
MTLRIDDNPLAKKLGVKEWQDRELILPKPEEYLVAEMIPANSLVCLQTNGVYGKTTLAMQLAMTVAFDLSFLGSYACLQPGKVLFLSARDTDDDNHRRFKRLVREWSRSEPGIEQKIENSINNLTCISMYDDCYGMTPHLVDVSGSNSKTYTYLYQFIEYYKIKLVVLDPVEDFFPENLKNVSELYRKLRHLKVTVLMIVGDQKRYDAFHGVEVGLFLNEHGLRLKNFYAGHREIPLEIGAGIWTAPAA